MHTILYDNAQSDENEALPMGNGVFGGMSYFKENRYTVALNHYEVYYSAYERYSRVFQEKMKEGEIPLEKPPNTCEGYRKAAVENTRDYTKEAYLHYRKTIWPQADTIKQTPLHRGVSQPPTGELCFFLHDAFDQADDYRLCLDIERATTTLAAQKGERTLRMDTVTLADCDAVVCSVGQSASSSLSKITLTHPRRRNQKDMTRAFYKIDNSTFCGIFSFYPHNEDKKRFLPFCFAVAMRLIGVSASAEIKENRLTLCLKDDAPNYHIVTTVLTELQSDDLINDAVSRLNEIEKRLPQYKAAHRAHWEGFFQKSGVSLPDKFLERLWYYNLYILNCCSGKGGKRLEQASGLNGLWDICQPTVWGSQWYWDVNIQATYWPVYTANHLELAEVFCEGFLSYAGFARQRARTFYHAHGCAIDYPFEFYNCIWPWCAQFLWWYYEYTQDVGFLREKAYPMFQEQIAFIRDILQYDEKTNTAYFFPDVSPEQGPITRNSTITLSTVKYLLQMAIKANRLLNESPQELEEFRALLLSLPDYSTAQVGHYGEALLDSELAPPGIPLRHPSLLMPIFPIDEMTQFSEEKERKIAENTVCFAAENTELGVFPFGWIAAAAARLGKGNMALRVLYKQGLDLILRANGMGAEETDRFINHCLVEAGPLYSPCMMECVGEIVACVNEMLLQSVQGEIVVFPALPNGDEEKERRAYRQRPLIEPLKKTAPKNWADCSFQNLLAKGGFAVSALQTGGRVRCVRLKSLCGGPVRLRLPTGLPSPEVREKGRLVTFQIENGALCFATEKGKEYWIAKKGALWPCKEAFAPVEGNDSFCYVSHLGRWVFAGKDRNTDAIKRMDSFLFDGYLANERLSPLVPYCFTFGVSKETPQKEIQAPVYEPQRSVEKRFIKITPQLSYTDELGFGWREKTALCATDTAKGNCLLRDFITAKSKAVFCVELPKGIYQLLVVSGGSDEPSETEASVEGGNAICLKTRPGEYKAEVLFIQHKAGGPLDIRLASEKGNCWNLNALLIRKTDSLL